MFVKLEYKYQYPHHSNTHTLSCTTKLLLYFGIITVAYTGFGNVANSKQQTDSSFYNIVSTGRTAETLVLLLQHNSPIRSATVLRQ